MSLPPSELPLRASLEPSRRGARAAAVGALLPAFALALLAGCASTSKSDQELRAAANDALRGREYERVVALDSELMRRHADDYDATLQRGIAFDRLGRDNVALADYSRAIELGPDKSLPRLYRANLALRVGRNEIAREDVAALKGMDLESGDHAATLTLDGALLQLAGDHGGALTRYQQAIAVAQRDPQMATAKTHRDALHNAAQCHYHLGDFAGAISAMNSKLELMRLAGIAPGEEEHYLLGLCHYMSGRFGEAKQHFGHVSPARRAKAAKVLNDEPFFAS